MTLTTSASGDTPSGAFSLHIHVTQKSGWRVTPNSRGITWSMYMASTEWPTVEMTIETSTVAISPSMRAGL